jgi:hypothetical protein
MLPPSQPWLPPRRLLPLFATLSTLPLADNSRVLGQLILGAPGAGKTVLLSLCLLVDLLRGLPGCVLDPLGTLSEAFLFRLAWFLSEFPQGDDERLWQRLRYIPLGQAPVTRFPLYYQRPGETLWDAGNRLITVLERASPQLVTGSPLTWPSAKRLGGNAGMLLTALGYGGLAKIEDLLFHTIEWDKSGRFQEAINRNLQATEAVSYFRNYYLPLSRSEKSRLAGTFLDQIFPLTANPTLREVFSGSSTPGIDWEEVEALGQIVILNCKGITNPTARSFALQWVFESLYPHLQGRGRRTSPFVVTIDEFAHLAAAGTAENKPLADLFDEFLAQYARNNQVFVTAALRSVDQVDERLARTLFRLGTLITGRAGSMREARVIADHLFRKDIYRVQHYRTVWGKLDPPPFFARYSTSAYAPSFPPFNNYFVLDYEPEHMSLENQTEDAAGRIQQLSDLKFLCRPATGDVISICIADAITDPDTGEGIFLDPEQDATLIAQIQHELAARSGIPVTDILQEEEARLTQGTPQTPRKTQPVAEVGERQLAQLPDGTQPEPRKAKTNPSLPALDEQQKALLAFLIEHPDTPISGVYKGLGVSVRKGNEIRDSLKEQGFLLELELRSGKAGAGRPMKCIMPSFQTFEQLGIAPPKGRGSMLHRQLQQLVAEGAMAKGYSTHKEKVLANGTIVDVHLEKGQETIAVEIAIASRPELELAHFRNCLAAGYDQVFAIFADTELLVRTETAIGEAFSEDVAGRVRLLPVSKISQLGK